MQKVSETPSRRDSRETERGRSNLAFPAPFSMAHVRATMKCCELARRQNHGAVTRNAIEYPIYGVDARSFYGRESESPYHFHSRVTTVFHYSGGRTTRKGRTRGETDRSVRGRKKRTCSPCITSLLRTTDFSTGAELILRERESLSLSPPSVSPLLCSLLSSFAFSIVYGRSRDRN